MNEQRTTEDRVKGNGHIPTAVQKSPGPSTAVTGVAGGQARQPRRSQDERIQERVDRVRDPSSLLLVMKSQEGWMLASLLFPFDKAIQRVRRGIGSRVGFEDAQQVLAKVELWSNQVRDVLRPIGSVEVDYRYREPIGDIQERVRIASSRNALVVVPRVQDTARAAPLIRALDDALLRLRMEAPSLESYRGVFEAVATLIVDFHRIVEHASRLTNTPYEAWGDVAKLVRHRQGLQ